MSDLAHDQQYARPKEVIERLHGAVTARTLAMWARDGRLPYVTTRGGHRRYRADGVEALLAEMGFAADAGRDAVRNRND